MSIRIRIFASREIGDTMRLKGEIEKMCESCLLLNYGNDKEIYIVDSDSANYTHAIILNTGMPELNIPKNRVVGLSLEPIPFLNLTPEFVNYARHNIGKYYVGDKYDLPEPFTEGYSYMWHNTPLTYIPQKTNQMSIMVSQKNNAPGHKYRHKLAQAILNTNIPIDIHGRGGMYYEKLNDSRVKGNFKELEPYESYHFHICIENFQSNHYFSEKIVNTLLCGGTPIYWGCHNIEQYFNDYAIRLSGDVTKDMSLLTDILRNPEKYKKNIDIDLVKQKTSLLHNLKTLF